MSDLLAQEIDRRGTGSVTSAMPVPFERTSRPLGIALLTGGIDKPYVLGLTKSLTDRGLIVDVIGSDELACSELTGQARINFFNLRGDQSRTASAVAKVFRIAKYYFRLVWYVCHTKARIFHILWNNRFELVDRILLMLLYRMLGKKIVFTAHNVNAAKRDGTDSFFNRVSLRIQYGLSNHLFVHTEKMRDELEYDFDVPESKITVIPFGINSTLPFTRLTSAEARQSLGLNPDARVLLFFGRITPYKGLQYLVDALALLTAQDERYRLVIAGSVKDCEEYWAGVQKSIAHHQLAGRIVERIEFIPDDKVEWYFKAADAFVLPYTDIFQSGVLFLGYNFGLPVIATDVGSLREEIVEGRTGFVCPPRNPDQLAKTIESYFAGDLYSQLEARRTEIRDYASDRYSWAKVGSIIDSLYSRISS